MNEIALTPEEVNEKRRYERYELFLPVKFKIFSDSGAPVTADYIDGFSRNYSKQGLLVEFAGTETQLNPDSLVNAIVKGDIRLPVVDAPIPFEGEVKWLRPLGGTKYFIGLYLSFIDDFHRLQLLHFAKKINRRQKIITSLVFTLFITITLTIMAIFSFNAYIDKMAARQRQVFDELNSRVNFLTDKLGDITTQIKDKNKN